MLPSRAIYSKPAVFPQAFIVYDVLQGKYPAYLKRRILSTKGHLSNETAGHTAVRLAQRGVKRFFLGHLSQENNREDVALSAVCGALTAQQIQPGRDVALAMAHRNCRSTLVVLDR